jgi:hypothetical protein
MMPHSRQRSILYLDLYAFYVSVERLQDKRLTG